MKYKRSITIFFRNFAAIMTQDRLWNANYCKDFGMRTTVR